MAFDEGLAERLRDVFSEYDDVHEKKMFGGLCFMLSRHMCCGIVKDRLMLRVGPNAYDECLALTHVSKMDFTGKPMKGMIYVAPEGFYEDEELCSWVRRAVEFVLTLPPKN